MIPDKIKTAIRQEKELHLKLLPNIDSYEFIDVVIQPYILGEDVLKNEFIWGYVSEKNIFYKIPTVLIVEVELLERPCKCPDKKTFNRLITKNYSGFLEGFQIQDSDLSGSIISQKLLLNFYQYLSIHN